MTEAISPVVGELTTGVSPFAERSPASVLLLRVR